MNSAFRELRGLSDSDLAERGIIRISGRVYMIAANIISFELRPAPDASRCALVITTRRSDHVIPPAGANRVLSLILRADESRRRRNVADFREFAAANHEAIGAAVAKCLATGESELSQRIRLTGNNVGAGVRLLQ